jgi:hypothetical protein
LQTGRSLHIVCIKLIPAQHRIEELKEDYEQMREMFMGECPEFEDIMETIRSLELEIHKA